MINSKNNKFQNHWLAMLDSVEENLKYYCRQYAASGSQVGGCAAVPHYRNDWLNCASSVENVLQTLSLHSSNLGEQAKVLKGEGLVSNRAYRLILRFQALGTLLAERSISAQTRELHTEYCQLADQIMPTLARINKRVAARRYQLEMSCEGEANVCHGVDDTIDVALRAASKLRQ